MHVKISLEKTLPLFKCGILQHILMFIRKLLNKLYHIQMMTHRTSHNKCILYLSDYDFAYFKIASLS